MNRRYISSFAMLPLLILVGIGGWALFILTLLVSAAAMYEFYRGFEKGNIKPNMYIGYGFYLLWMTALGIFRFGGVSGRGLAWMCMFWLFLAVVGATVYAIFSKKKDIFEGPLGLLGTFYIGYFASHVVLVEGSGDTGILVWLIPIAAFVTDIFAFFAGNLFGKRFLAPHVSPKKTVEGAVGGIIGSTAVSFIFALIFARDYLLHCLIIGAFGSVFAQLGDLTASAFKRGMGIKDFGSIIPGHGGIMDRFDSLLFAAPFVYYYIVLFIR